MKQLILTTLVCLSVVGVSSAQRTQTDRSNTRAKEREATQSSLREGAAFGRASIAADRAVRAQDRLRESGRDLARAARENPRDVERAARAQQAAERRAADTIRDYSRARADYERAHVEAERARERAGWDRSRSSPRETPGTRERREPGRTTDQAQRAGGFRDRN